MISALPLLAYALIAGQLHYGTSSTGEAAREPHPQDRVGLAGPSTVILGSAVSGAGFDARQSCQPLTPADLLAIDHRARWEMFDGHPPRVMLTADEWARVLAALLKERP